VKSAKTGFDITLPANHVGTIKVISNFGDSETNEGSVCQIVSGEFNPRSPNLYVAEKK